MEIKIRAWDKEGKSMFNVLGISWYDDEIYESYADSWRGGYSKEKTHKIEDCILMLYTNKKDKNKNKIYVSDIIKQRQWINEVIFKDGMFGVERPVGYPTGSTATEMGFFPIWQLDDIEKIGNKFENPELLEKKNETTV